MLPAQIASSTAVPELPPRRRGLLVARGCGPATSWASNAVCSSVTDFCTLNVTSKNATLCRAAFPASVPQLGAAFSRRVRLPFKRCGVQLVLGQCTPRPVWPRVVTSSHRPGSLNASCARVEEPLVHPAHVLRVHQPASARAAPRRHPTTGPAAHPRRPRRCSSSPARSRPPSAGTPGCSRDAILSTPTTPPRTILRRSTRLSTARSAARAARPGPTRRDRDASV